MDKGKNQTLIVKIVCILLSFGLWLYISTVENPVRTYEIRKVPVELVNLDTLKDSKFSVVNNQEFTVDLKVEGPSNEIIKIKKENFKVVADMSTYALKEGENTIPVQILTYPENITIKNNGFLGIRVILEKYITKDFNITSNVKLSYKEHIYENSKSINPQVVSVSGGESQVERISKAVLVGEEKDIQSNFSNTYEIKFLDDLGEEVTNIEASNKTAQLIVTVKNGKSVPINIRTTGNLPAGYILENSVLSQSTVNISGEDNVLDSVDKIDTEYIDISNLIESSTFTLKLNVPEGITLKNAEETVNVTFTIVKESPISKEIICNVDYINLPNEFSIENSTQSVKVNLYGLKDEVDRINSDNIQVIMNLESVTEEGTFTYTPEVKINNPSTITVSDVGSVEVTLKKKM
ncbi:MAG: hypothetical protein E7208_06530 [Clostridium butyricum]|nr:hypothetical protein [Clostridium butyricum]